MPCYSRWDEYMDKTSASYFGAKRQIEAKLESVKQIVDYYFAAAGMEMPKVKGKPPFFLKDANATFEETRLLDIIAHHFTCDGIHFCTLYDTVTVLSQESPIDRSYERVILVCANEIRGRQEHFRLPPERRSEREDHSNEGR